MTTTPHSPKQSRSPAYPAVPLETAVESARKLWNAQRKQESHIDSTLKALGYAARSGTALRAIAALSHYGLVEETGSKDDRKFRLSEAAQDILHLAETDDRRRRALKAAALSPKIHASLWERYGPNLPDDGAITPYLIRDKGYNDAVVDSIIANYRATLEFAKLDKVEDSNPEGAVQSEERNGEPENGVATDLQDSSSKAKQAAASAQELPILVGDNRIARIPFPMSEDDFDLLIGTLNLWKKKLLAAKSAAEPGEPARVQTRKSASTEDLL
jgi:hypothetical protein